LIVADKPGIIQPNSFRKQVVDRMELCDVAGAARIEGTDFTDSELDAAL